MSFLFFMFVTVVMSFLLNWVFMTYLHTCGCPTTKYSHESDKLQQSSPTTVVEDVDDFLSS